MRHHHFMRIVNECWSDSSDENQDEEEEEEMSYADTVMFD